MPSDNNEFYRMDFVQEIVDYEETDDGVIAKVAMRPNPERYERIENEDFDGYYDRLDNVYIPISTLKDAAEDMGGTPIYYSPPDIDDIRDYIQDREEAIQEFLNGETGPPGLSDASEELLQDLAEENDTRFVILSIDLVGSTRLSQEMEDEKYRTYIQLFFREISLLIQKFRGYVLDYQGDRIISYFPDPNYTGMHDNAIDCASCIRRMILEGLNPILRSQDMPEIHFRIGMDSGQADIATIGASGVRGELSLFGETINLASKIEEVAEEDAIYIGEETESNLHTRWRSHTEEVNLDDWDYQKPDGELYRAYEFQL